jgi:SNF2 family DNA or RNA helicase
MQTPQQYVYGTEPYAHQREGFERSADLEAFALSMEQGTGKTKVVADTAAYRYCKGHIDALVIIAPNGVHRNWIRKELPKHFPQYVKWRGVAWSSTAKVKEWKEWDALTRGPRTAELRVFAFNTEAIHAPRVAKELKLILDAFTCLLAVDESSRIKNPTAARTKTLLNLAPRARIRRTLTGTPVTQSPLDVFAPYTFLDETILGTTSYTVFRARHCEMLPADDPLVKSMKDKHGLKYTPAIQRTGADGKPIYKNLEKLQAQIAPFTYRVLKADCLDLPEKVYTVRHFELAPEQRRWYNEITRLIKAGVGLDVQTASKPISKLAAFTYIQQITSGIVPAALSPSGVAESVFDDPRKNPRIDALLDQIEETDESFLIWCRYTLDIENVAAVLRAKFGADVVTTLYGDTSSEDRDAAEDGIQSGRFRFLVGNAQAAGIGRTMTRATQNVYYSNTFRLEDRLQSEDRSHRIGVETRVLYTDLIAEGTFDERIVKALVAKKDVADLINGDEGTQWIRAL